MKVVFRSEVPHPSTKYSAMVLNLCRWLDELLRQVSLACLLEYVSSAFEVGYRGKAPRTLPAVWFSVWTGQARHTEVRLALLLFFGSYCKCCNEDSGKTPLYCDDDHPRTAPCELGHERPE